MLCLADLAQIVSGTIHFGPLPPVDGKWAHIASIAVDSHLVVPGDLFWRLPGLPVQSACSTQHALFQGAAGVVTSSTDLAAWPGRFCLEVENPVSALAQLIDWLDADDTHEHVSELKNLQLCRYYRLDMTPPICGRAAGARARSRCSRRAA